jgi:hypothetical protein
MKKLLYVLVALSIFSCSNSDDSSSTSSSDFHPPTWIQGTWKALYLGQDLGIGYTFTSNDFCTVMANSEQCQQGLVDIMRKSGEKPKVEEIISSTSYSVKVTYGAGQSVMYLFIKTSNTTIEFDQGAGMSIEYTKK